jgi:hypothetical protein
MRQIVYEYRLETGIQIQQAKPHKKTKVKNFHVIKYCTFSLIRIQPYQYRSMRIRVHNTEKKFFAPYLLAARAAASDAESQKERIRKRRESGRSRRWVEPWWHGRTNEL